LSTAVASFALTLTGVEDDHALAARGMAWLTQHQNRDGGWGDTPISGSNLSTTVLCWCALSRAASLGVPCVETVARAEAWIRVHAGGIEPHAVSKALLDHYGKDRTFSAPILTMCALAGRLGPGASAWACIPHLPFELAILPARFFSAVRLPVVSYALPALIAIGQARHHHLPSRCPFTRAARTLARNRTIRILERIQPSNGGFLEATPLTGFVTMSLASIGLRGHAVTQRAAAFLRRSMRDDGGWPIDTNLATWVTTLAVGALSEVKVEVAEAAPWRVHADEDRHCTRRTETLSLPPSSSLQEEPSASDELSQPQRAAISSWLLDQQHTRVHPYTNAAPGGWAWTDLPGGVPDADDTSSALLALRQLAAHDARALNAAQAGVRWLLGLQNSDGGIPTFCRGWGALPFDHSCPDITAHALRAWAAWRNDLPAALQRAVDKASRSALAYLARTQQQDGSWLPLWFGNEHAPRHGNPVYGTAQVVLALEEPDACASSPMLAAGRAFLLRVQNTDGGWGGAAGCSSSIEETSLALCALASSGECGESLHKGAQWLVQHCTTAAPLPAAPVGLYFASLWYYEELYPLIFATRALRRLAGPPST
ncbi:squalene--hopene cyclase, partial [bacterium]|nr:squalene--hopene cyclase [bacterium]